MVQNSDSSPKKTKSSFFRLFAIFLTVSLMFSFTASTQAASINLKLSGVLPAAGDVQEFKISPDGRFVVFLADAEIDGSFHLYSVGLMGGTPIRLSGTLPVEGRVTSFDITSDSQRVIYIADQKVDDVDELNSVPITGGTVITLNGALTSGGDVDTMLISPDGQTIVYRADQDLNDVFELYSVPAAGGTAPVKLNTPLVAGRNVEDDFLISPNNQWVVYRADIDIAGVTELYRNSISGGANLKLHPPIIFGRMVYEFKITPNSLGVVYRGRTETAMEELYINWIDGTPGGPYRLSDNTTNGAISKFDISPNSGRVVFIADQETINVFELYTATTFATDKRKLSGTLPAGSDVTSFAITPNSLGVVYVQENDSGPDHFRELYSKYLAAGGEGPFKLNDDFPTGSSGVHSFAITPNNAGVVYIADQETATQNEIYAVPITGSVTPNMKLNGTMVVGGDVSDFLLTTDSLGVIYKARQDSIFHIEVYSNSTLGGALLKLNGLLNWSSEVRDFALAPNNHAVVYTADQDTFDKIELYVTFVGPVLYLPLLFR